VYINGNNPADAYIEKTLRAPLIGDLADPSAQGLELGDSQNYEEEKFGCIYGFKRAFGWTVSREKRAIKLDGTTRPSSFPSNKLNN
jgi:hypothetical protein